jgi:hypothetical protein
MSIDERLEALAMNLELLHRDLLDLRVQVDRIVVASQQDGENIRTLLRIAEIREQRLTRPPGQES